MLSRILGIQSHLVLAVMRDRASVNNSAMHILSVVYPKLLDVGCFFGPCRRKNQDSYLEYILYTLDISVFTQP